MIRRPPRSTLFPTRRSSDLQSSQLDQQTAAAGLGAGTAAGFAGGAVGTTVGMVVGGVLSFIVGVIIGLQWGRSEEHTSELQSRQYLVCRLLLEKKKTHNFTTPSTNANINSTNSTISFFSLTPSHSSTQTLIQITHRQMISTTHPSEQNP